MSIFFNEQKNMFTLQTKNSTYQMKVDEFDFLTHTYYGEKIEEGDMEYLITKTDISFSGNPAEAKDRTFSLDVLPQEYSSVGIGDYRISSINLIEENGCNVFEPKYSGYKIKEGVKEIEGMPYIYDNGDKPKTLEIYLKDKVTNIEITLNYTIFYEMDIIARSATLKNNSNSTIKLNKIMSSCLDFYYKDLELIHFHGRHAMERLTERTILPHGITSISSKRGTSSHQHNPSVILCEKNTTEDFGNCYGMALVYSGNFLIEIEKDQLEQIRANIGINPENFQYEVKKGEIFETPQVLITFSDKGLSKLSHNFHKAIRNNICRGKYKLERRPILINNWEATYFDFDDDKIINIAKQASDLGIEMFVLDDGWFGKRNDDNSGLGDWFVNKNKLKNGLDSLVKNINNMGMKFGIWFEPEMISEDSDLFRKNPDWSVKLPNRSPNKSRNQLVLDMSRDDVRDYLFECISTILDNANIEYIKWDMNRSICDAFSAYLAKDNQGEFYHKYVLGLYNLLERIITKYPNILLEGCSGGGGRFDMGMLYYSPQIWCSDNTDAIERLEIQYGTSFIYPISTVGSHVSAIPNHQTGRKTNIDTRAIVAMSGSFGYEMDLGVVSEGEKLKVKEQIRDYKKYQPIIHNGLYYRLSKPNSNDWYTAWQFVSDDLKESLLNIVVTKVGPNKLNLNIKLKGLDKNKKYKIENDDKIYTGDMLMKGGIVLKNPFGDFPTYQIYIKEVEE
ncbi:alpha-galactosidase [[Clostridium] colinum]|uniref:alpha-galactosidase n=1 Tax=[Clostridium] colinum TaxID=36835 RepID=UPI002023C2D7|nr:alpha-galactosidase [[Clostridium] colinum]